MIVLELSSKISFKREDMYRLLIQKAIEAWKRLQPLFLRWLSGAPPWTSAREHSQKGGGLPQSSIARIESFKTTPKWNTAYMLLHIGCWAPLLFILWYWWWWWRRSYVRRCEVNLTGIRQCLSARLLRPVELPSFIEWNFIVVIWHDNISPSY